MTESQRIVLNWKAKLKAMGWPEDAVRSVVQELCEAGYRQCVDDLKAKQSRNEALIAGAQDPTTHPGYVRLNVVSSAEDHWIAGEETN